MTEATEKPQESTENVKNWGNPLSITTSAENAKAFVGAISMAADEAILVYDANGVKAGVRSKVVDPSHVLMVDVYLSAQACDFYASFGGKAGVDIDTLAGKLKGAVKKSAVGLSLRDGKVSYSVDSISGEFPAIDDDRMTVPKGPVLNLKTVITVSVKEMARWLKDAADVSDHACITVDDAGITFSSEQDGRKSALVIPDPNAVISRGDGPTMSMFSLDYLASILKEAKRADGGTVTMYLGFNYPVRIDWTFGQGAGSVSVLLACRIENE